MCFSPRRKIAASAGDKRERVECGDRNREGNGKRKLLIENARRAGKERDRHEHGDEHQRSSDDRAGDLGHRHGRSRVRVGLVIVDMALHVLDHHDGIVHHQARRQRDAEHGQRIDGKAEDLDEGERAHQRDRDGDGRDDGCAPVEQKEKDDDNDNDDCFAQRAHDFADGVADNGGGVERNLTYVSPWRK